MPNSKMLDRITKALSDEGIQATLEPGWYWVKISGRWQVAAYSVSPVAKFTGWKLHGIDETFSSLPFTAIERIPDHE